MASSDAIERVLYVAPSLHVYMIPPMASGRGHIAANWTKPPAQEIFIDQASKLSPRLRVLERSPLSNEPSTSRSAVAVSILLEDPNSGELFAAAPYTHANIVMQAVDSSRFFALTVTDQGRKAVLGIGFEERNEAFDFSVALQEARKALGWEEGAGNGPKGSSSKKQQAPAVKRDWSLKEGETVHVDVPRIRREKLEASDPDGPNKSAFGSGDGFGLLPPPPSASQNKERRRSVEIVEAKKKELADLGFDDGEFGEFQ